MKTKIRGSSTRRDTVALAGWLFADLLLGLAMLFFVFNTVGLQPTPTPPTLTSTTTSTPTKTPTITPTPSPTLTSTPSPTPLPTYTPYPTLTPLPTYTPFPLPTSAIGLDRESFATILETNADVLLGPDGPAKNTERDKIRQQIHEKFRGHSSGRAGFVLTFGIAPQPSEGNKLAVEVNQLLLQEFPEVFNVAILRSYHTIEKNTSLRGEVEVEVYFLIGTAE